MKRSVAERGQALVEVLILIPVVLICVVGFMGIISMQKRIFMENVTKYNVDTSFAVFGTEELESSQWRTLQGSQQAEAEKIGELTLNTPRDFVTTPHADAALEKRVLVNATAAETNCDAHIQVTSHHTRSNKSLIKLQGCSKENGWANIVPGFLNSDGHTLRTLEENKNILSNVLKSDGIYVPQNEIAFSNRGHLPHQALLLRPSSFDADFAQDGEPEQNKNLNRDCFFNPYATSERCKPRENIGVTYAVMGRYSNQTFLFQFAICEAEVWARYGWVVALLGMGEVKMQWRLGNKSYLCKTAQKGFENYAKFREISIKSRLVAAEVEYFASNF